MRRPQKYSRTLDFDPQIVSRACKRCGGGLKVICSGSNRRRELGCLPALEGVTISLRLKVSFFIESGEVMGQNVAIVN